MEDSKKVEKDEPSHVGKTHIVQIVLGILALTGVFYTGWINMRIQKSKEEHEKYMREIDNIYEQEFHMSEKITTRAGIEYIEYEISAKPSVNGFHVIPYVYAVIKTTGGEKYIPVKGQFHQDEYVAKQDGTCILSRENTTKDLLEALKEQGREARVECMVAIEYTEAGKSEVNVYNLRTGQLEAAEEEKVLTIIGEWENLNQLKIDMVSWPIGSDEQLKELLKELLIKQLKEQLEKIKLRY